MAKRYRTITEQLGSLLLIFEVFSVGLCGLAIFGLRALPAWIALGGAALFIVLMLVGVYVLRFSWGRWYVLALHLALVMAGLVNGAMYVVGGLFLAIWLYCMVRGGKIDAERAPVIAEYERAQAAESSSK
ncbi:DUF4233 domain-containing protein [Gulosibacter bifidus]|uniref:DUF4233 domain-containing protein n=1 Tax=Gulosibacter bifidus TaxID=272239 RepID=A0ABW5RJL1_9MICO|nr:DUF4233 domain-containing protein [Gulosibacter bifidus]